MFASALLVSYPQTRRKENSDEAQGNLEVVGASAP